ncbi:DUF397 domain-containing protein [Nocardia sp. NPDC051750]|uniref:DUF397 domain-containing protein n=1 Tax=Nocardia sp. NPDC051750 TaxID=3364325 RepID=UPI0037AFABB6
MTILDLSGATWFKSSRSGSQSACVEVAWLKGGDVGVRDSKDPNGPALVFTGGQWDSLAAGIREGKFTPLS